MKNIVIIVALAILGISNASIAADPVCAKNVSPYRDLDFLIGKWNFFTEEGKLIANQTYHKKEKGCLILEEWKTISGETGTGMNFYDPEIKKWRQVWMSPRFYIDYSGNLDESGNWVLEGRIYPNNGEPSSSVRGIYTRNEDGSITKEFLKYDDKDEIWKQFFIGIAQRPKISEENTADNKPQDLKQQCHSNHKLTSSLDFLPGRYEYYLENGKKLGETEYRFTSGGCAILEQFKDMSGDLSVGVLNLDIAKGKWRHFWSSKRFTFEVFGEPLSDNKLMFEGNIINHSSGVQSPLKAIWTVDNKGNIKHSFEIYDFESKSWEPFFSDVSKKIN